MSATETALPPLVEQLVSRHGATRIALASLDDFAADPVDGVLFLSGDPVRFPECLDIAVVLPEMQRVFAGRLRVGVVPRADEDAVAARYGARHWPSLVFVRAGHWVSTIAGMHDWDVFVRSVAEVLAKPASRAPSVGIAVVSAGTAGSATGCH
jgi:hydrogenase-1 operon protein HyaE